MYHLLFYDVVSSFVERRTSFREAHLALAREAQQRDELMMAGSFGEPVDGAVLVFRCTDSCGGRTVRRARPLRDRGARHEMARPQVARGAH